MIQTNYDYDAIRSFRKKYKWMRWSYQIFYPLILILMLLRLHLVIPNWYDTFGYYDTEFDYHYLFGIKNCIMDLTFIFTCIVLFIIIPYILKRILKERYIEFLMAKHNGNIKYPRIGKIVRRVILIFTILLAVLSFNNINSITVTDTGFYVKQNILLFSPTKKYTFDYLETHKPHAGDSSGGVAFYKDDENGSVLDFEIGKYSPYLMEFLEVLDKKTDYQYYLYARLSK